MDEQPWDQEGEHLRADFEHLLERMESDFFERGIESAEERIGSMPPTADVPMPNSVHPGLERFAEFVRSYDRDTVFIAVPRPMVATCTAEAAISPVAEATIGKRVLSRSRAAGPAPFIGDARYERATYWWWVWTDEVKRHITSHAELVIAPY